ncbi:hypothetical protein KKA03_01970 [archaeon]|nr:hypothetical protein [archaeon]
MKKDFDPHEFDSKSRFWSEIIRGLFFAMLIISALLSLRHGVEFYDTLEGRAFIFLLALGSLFYVAYTYIYLPKKYPEGYEKFYNLQRGRNVSGARILSYAFICLVMGNALIFFGYLDGIKGGFTIIRNLSIVTGLIFWIISGMVVYIRIKRGSIIV